jgi:hypothetical protein
VGGSQKAELIIFSGRSFVTGGMGAQGALKDLGKEVPDAEGLDERF